MTATERRIQLAIVLRNRKSDTIDNLAFEFGVCRNTIKNDLLFLTEYRVQPRNAAIFHIGYHRGRRSNDNGDRG